MIRYNYLNLEFQKNGINFYDITQFDWNEFQFKRGFKTYKLSKEDVNKFYMVCKNEYDNMFIEDLIYYVNKIDDPTELEEGMEIILPKFEDINDFINEQLNIQT